VEIKVDPSLPSPALHHSLPPFIPLDELLQHHLYHNVKGFVEAVHQYLVPFVMRREEVLKMEVSSGLQIEGVLVYFSHLKCQRCIEDALKLDTFLQQKKFWGGEIDPLVCFVHWIAQEYVSKCHKMYLITLKVFKIC
jgi:hypothetical protein